jgi:hypothetical protein
VLGDDDDRTVNPGAAYACAAISVSRTPNG